MANIENLKRVIAHIEAHPETWRQDSGHCGTTHCFAGHAQIMSGCKANDETARRDARVFLDLSLGDADYLFSANRTLADFHAFINAGGIPE
jgi:hypothetical protein